MGFLVWAGLTTLALLAGLAFALRIGPRLSLGEQVVGACLVAITLVVAPTQALGYAGVLYAWTLGPAVAVLSVLLLTVANPGRGDLRHFVGRITCAARRSIAPGTVAVLLPVTALVLYLAAYVWLLPSWSWDALWYHNPISALAFQDHSFQWHDTPIPWANSYPKNIELLALWNVLFSPDDRFLDAVQLPMAFIGVTALASMARRAGAPPSLAWGLSLSWLLIPAVFLNIPSNYIDVGCASLWFAAVLFLVRTDATGTHRLFGALALGLYAGSKVTGAQHAALIAPLVLFLAWRDTHRRRAFMQVATMGVGIALLGGATYIRDWLRFGNPVWPVQVKLLGKTLPGTVDMKPLTTPPWGGPADFHALWRSFFERNPPYMVDVRVGGFGPLWPWVLLPLVVVALVMAARRRSATIAMPILVLLGVAVLTPGSWWGRYTLGIPAAGFLAAAVVLTQLRYGIAQVALAGIALFASVQAWPAREGFHAPLDLLRKAWLLPPQARDALPVGIWQQEWISRREDIVQPGNASVYDDSVELLYPLWRFDWQNRVLYRPWTGSASAWLHQLEADRARWAAIRAGSLAESALRNAGWTYFGPCPREQCAVWAKPATTTRAVAAP